MNKDCEGEAKDEAWREGHSERDERERKRKEEWRGRRKTCKEESFAKEEVK